MSNQNRALFVAKKNELYALIKEVGVAYQHPLDDLRSYAKFVALEWEHDLDRAIACFRDLKQQAIELGLMKKYKSKPDGHFKPYLGKLGELYR